MLSDPNHAPEVFLQQAVLQAQVQIQATTHQRFNSGAHCNQQPHVRLGTYLFVDKIHQVGHAVLQRSHVLVYLFSLQRIEVEPRWHGVSELEAKNGISADDGLDKTKISQS